MIRYALRCDKTHRFELVVRVGRGFRAAARHGPDLLRGLRQPGGGKGPDGAQRQRRRGGVPDLVGARLAGRAGPGRAAPPDRGELRGCRPRLRRRGPAHPRRRGPRPPDHRRGAPRGCQGADRGRHPRGRPALVGAQDELRRAAGTASPSISASTAAATSASGRPRSERQRGAVEGRAQHVGQRVERQRARPRLPPSPRPGPRGGCAARGARRSRGRPRRRAPPAPSTSRSCGAAGRAHRLEIGRPPRGAAPPAPRRPAAGRLDRLGDRGVLGLDHRVEERALVGEVVVERARASARPRRDLRRAGRGVTLRDEERPRRRNQRARVLRGALRVRNPAFRSCIHTACMLMRSHTCSLHVFSERSKPPCSARATTR